VCLVKQSVAPVVEFTQQFLNIDSLNTDETGSRFAPSLRERVSERFSLTAIDNGLTVRWCRLPNGGFGDEDV
jgi:hypothetical protein